MESSAKGFLNNFWSVPMTISLEPSNAFPKIAASLTNNTINAAAVWVTNDGTNNQVVASTGSKTLLLPLSNLDVMEGARYFWVFKEYFTQLT